MSGRRLTSLDMQEAKRATEIYNSQVNRGEIDITSRGATNHIACACGCGVKGCIFISTIAHRTPEEIRSHAEYSTRS